MTSKYNLTTSLLQIILITLVGLFEWTGLPVLGNAAILLTILLLAILAPKVGRTSQVFIAISAVLFAVTVATEPDWLKRTTGALQTAAFIGAFLSTLVMIRNASETSAPIQKCGNFLAQQPPGRRYLALTLGGYFFALVLSFGALVLLGQFASANTRLEPNTEVRKIRLRRMLLAIQRGFISTLTWSPLALSTVMALTFVSGSSWSGMLLPSLVSSLLLISTGWALDTILKPKPPAGYRPTPGGPEGSWKAVFPLFILLSVLLAGIGGLHFLTGIRIMGVIFLALPAISAIWILLQGWDGDIRQTVGSHVERYVFADLPGFRSELVLIMMAGFIGSLGSRLLLPVLQAQGIDFSYLPGGVLLVSLVWLIPILGQLGMNPVLSVSLIGPLLPDPAVTGIAPNDLVVAITAGWALSGVTSPFTATTTFVSSAGGVTPTHASLVWNGTYAAICGVLLSTWVIVNSLI